MLPLGLNRLEWAEREELVKVLREAKGNKCTAAAMVPMGRQTLYNKIKRYKITHEDFGHQFSFES